MLTAEAKIDSKGRVAIPAEVRAAAHLTEGARVFWTVDDMGRVGLETPETALDAIWADCAVDDGRSLVDELLAERRAEALADGGPMESSAS